MAAMLSLQALALLSVKNLYISSFVLKLETRGKRSYWQDGSKGQLLPRQHGPETEKVKELLQGEKVHRKGSFCSKDG